MTGITAITEITGTTGMTGMTGNPDQLNSRQVEMILAQVDTLPTLSPIAARVLNLGSSDQVDLQEIGRLIESDPALAARILGLCRKASTGLGDKITSVRRAVVMLGMDAVRSAVLSVSVYDLMSERSSAADLELSRDDPGAMGMRAACFDRVGFWKNALAVACCAELIAKREKNLCVIPEEAFVSGLLHGLGRLVLDLVLPQSYSRVIALAERRQVETSTLENQILGVDHHIAGKRCAEHWGLPPQLQDVMWLYGTPYQALPEATDKQLIGVVSLARAYCRELYLGWSGDFGVPPSAEALAAELGVDASTLDAITQELHSNVVERFAALGLDETTTPQLMLQSLIQANRQLSRFTVALQERASQSEQFSRSLAAISQFHSADGPSRGVAGTMEQVCRSAAQLLGTGTAIAVVQVGEKEPWQVMRFAPDGRVSDSKVFNPPSHATSLRDRMAGARPGGSASLLGATFLESIDGLCQTCDLCLTPIRTGGKAAGALLLDHDSSRVAAIPEALTTAWEAALRASTQQDEGKRLAEQFNQLNRTLIQTQSKLSEAESMAKLGAVTAGAAHEMNNPLTVISGRGQLLLTTLSSAREKAAAESIVDAARDLSDLITSLNLIAKVPKPEPAPVSIINIVEQANTFVKGRLGKPAPVSLKIGPGVEKIFVDGGMLARGLAEVLSNAAQSAPNEQAELTIETVGSTLTLTVQDSGTGFSEQALRHAFDPFFSERPAGRGRGLGLSRARSLISSMGGEITLSNTPGRGAQVAIHLPNWKEPAPPAQDRRTTPANPQRR